MLYPKFNTSNLENQINNQFIIPYLYNKQHGIVIETVVNQNIDLHKTLKQVLLQIIWYVDKSYRFQQRPFSYVKQETLAQKFGRSRETINRIIKKLKELKYIAIEKSKQKVNKYFILPDNFLFDFAVNEDTRDNEPLVTHEMKQTTSTETSHSDISKNSPKNLTAETVNKPASEFHSRNSKNFKNSRLDKTKETTCKLKYKNESVCFNLNSKSNKNTDPKIKSEPKQLKQFIIPKERYNEIKTLCTKLNLCDTELGTILNDYVEKSKPDNFHSYMGYILRYADIETIVHRQRKSLSEQNRAKQNRQKTRQLLNDMNESDMEANQYRNNLIYNENRINDFRQQQPQQYEKLSRIARKQLEIPKTISHDSIFYKVPFISRMIELIEDNGKLHNHCEQDKAFSNEEYQ